MSEKRISDEDLRELLYNGIPQEQIAALARCSPQAICQRVKSLEKKAAACAPAEAVQAVASMFDTREAADQNYRRCLALLDECETAADKRAALGEIRMHLQFGMQVLETLYTVQATQNFMKEVLNVIGEVDPDARDTILARLSEKRSLRAAFLPH